MKLSTKGRYGIMAMYELALHEGEDPLSISIIAQRQRIPEQYLVQLMKKLREKGLIESKRGIKGGYILAAPPSQITAGAIIRAVEEQTRPVECFGLECGNFESCAARTLWSKIGDAIENVIDHETLADMLNYHCNKEKYAN